MSKKSFLSAAMLLPLIVLLILALFGGKLSTWVYIVLGAVCFLVAGIIWFICRDLEKKMKIVEKETGRRR